MKTIKYILVIALIFQVTIANAQSNKQTKKYEVTVKDVQNSKLKLINLSGDIIITSNGSSKITIETTNLKPKPDRAEGLMQIGAGGEDNTAVGLNFTNNGNTLTFIGTTSVSARVDYKISIPKDLKVSVELGIFNNGDLEIVGLTSDLELDVKTSNVKLTEITGPTIVSSLSGNIEIDFSKLNQTSPFSIKAISGNIDISLPSNSPVNLALTSMSGSIFSDFSIKSDVEEAKNLAYVGGGSKVKTKLNSGGVDFSISAISGNIYLRKKK